MKVKTLSITKLHTASHVDFHQSAHQTINTTPALPIPALAPILTAWEADTDVENTLTRRARGSAITAAITAADKKRDDLMAEFFTAIKASLKSPIAARKAAAVAIDAVSRPYRNDATTSLTDQTQNLDGLLADVGADALAEHIETLALGAVIQNLRTANTDFKNLYAQRITETETRAPVSAVSTKEQRLKNDAHYRAAVDLLNAGALMLTGADRTAVEKVITSLNALVDQYKLVLASQTKTRGQSDDKIDSEVDKLRLRAAEAEIRKKRLEEKAARAAEKAAEALRKAEEKEAKRK